MCAPLPRRGSVRRHAHTCVPASCAGGAGLAPSPGEIPTRELVCTSLAWFPLSRSPRLRAVSPDPPKHANDDHSPLSLHTDRYRWQSQILSLVRQTERGGWINACLFFFLMVRKM